MSEDSDKRKEKVKETLDKVIQEQKDKDEKKK
jgi:hypothetical protein